MTSRLLALLLLALCIAATRSATATVLHRAALVVGANSAPPGRVPLRYAHEDARRVAEVLTTVAGFAAADVQVLLDPAPAAVLAALDAALMAAGQRRGKTLLFFYYSGHADEQGIFPGGETLAFTELRPRLEDPRAKLRIGLLDSCRGGSWTGTKGLKTVAPFQVEVGRGLAEEGSVLIASSSGLESAHETEKLAGSFFTHYWNAGLRGAADQGGDGVVTLGEAFEYARSLTIRDTALAGQAPQHPSFQMKLSGRRDFPLAVLSRGRTTLRLEQTTGPLELVRLSDGLVVAETEPGRRSLRLGLTAGSYLARRRARGGVWVRVVRLQAGSTTTLEEGQLELSRMNTSGSKGTSDHQAFVSWAGQSQFASLALGVRHAKVIDPGVRLGAADGTGVFLLRGSQRLARRFWLSAPLSAVFDAEREGQLNYFVWAGAPVLGLTRSGSSGWSLGGLTGAGMDARLRHDERLTFNAGAAAVGAFGWQQRGDPVAPTTWTTQVSLGFSMSIPDAVVFNLGVATSFNPLIDGELRDVAFASAERRVVLAFGSVQRAGLRPLPLIHVPVARAWSLDAHVAVAYEPAQQGWFETYAACLSYEH